MTTQERFLHYITYDTQSDEDSALTPSTPKQKRLGARLAQELQDLGLEHAHLAENGAVYGWLPATAGKEDCLSWPSSPTWTPRPVCRGRT